MAMTTEIGRETDGIAVAGLTGTPVIAIPAVARRLERRGLREKVTSDGTIAAGVMVVAAVAAIIVANSPAYGAVSSFLQTPLTLGVGSFSASLTVEGFVNDFLMAIFFLLVGIELKYEMTVGQLRQPRQAALPILAAVGGVMGPCIIYALLNMGGTHMDGWAVPMATDIAFALGVMSLLGDAVAPATKVFFSTLAIADDLLAIVVLALFYGQSPDPVWLAAIRGLRGRARPARPPPGSTRPATTCWWDWCCGSACSTAASTPRWPASSSPSASP
jgi:NhaA family Na+:H+ antiporter